MNKFLSHLALFIATGAYSGFFPKMPGTFGSAVACFIVYYFPMSINSQFVIILLTILIGIFSADWVETHYGKDAQIIVIDEFAGIFIACLITNNNLFQIILAFILFRFFDIVKPFGIKQLQRMKGGFAVMIDDIVAGFYTLIILGLLKEFIL